jgi:hypothetical protein
MSTPFKVPSAGQAHPFAHGSQFRPGLTTLLVLLIGAWLLAVVITGAGGLFEVGPARPPLPLLAAVLLPPAVFMLAYATAPRFKDFVLRLDLRMLTAVQSWRVLGAVFLFLYAFNLRPALFAFPAGLGDVAVGVTAVFVLRSMLNGHPTWRRRVLWLNLGGLLDFVVAVGTGVLTSNTSLGIFAPATQMPSMGEMPLSLVPTFAVPLWTIIHIASLLQLRRARG